MLEHWFWLLLSIAYLVWYATVTIYVAVRGSTDIRERFAQLARPDAREESAKHQD